MRYKDIAGLSQTELNERKDTLRKELVLDRFDKASGKLLNTAAPRLKRKELAKVLTRLSEIERKA
jgi:ribosomal protein L29